MYIVMYSNDREYYLCVILHTCIILLFLYLTLYIIEIIHHLLFSSLLIVAPKIMTPLREMKVRGGLTLTADIKFIGEPVPEVEWSLNGKTVTSGDRVSISNFDDHTILNIIDVKRSDSGPYTLSIKNQHGKDSGILDVNILGKTI